ncbi:GIY-YIG nuclease family protein [Porphyromonas gingivalis]|uniref:GIY-YIG nuclease family protein n=1 Tax=Porphyromonas gingivalis TaxID=837 RepID=UPI00036494D2|nr:hypothetical protein [Porphyromonas gingivalis]EOA11708.1 hypothetical protein A343_0821 [Porphyromonas gingivalis JCVI SC001]ATS02528.1 hypothetical protein CS059_05685 [Porphyromonas gingivalis]ERJ70654.1 hypothetical protein HMPREF1553_00126 [Porphyromonas gingivalis F0568]MCE8188405.1 hypothetical protein [Porphyromonas gingivalis]MCE8192426.1 hypothetical protein [Porphyromonas gingivalis]
MDKKERAKNAESHPFTSGFKKIDPKQNNANNIPDKSGICLICLREQAQLPDIDKEVEMEEYDGLRVIYIGISSRLKKRYKDHFKSNNLNKSTLRESLMAMFLKDKVKDEVNLNQWMKDIVNLSQWMKNIVDLSQWMKDNLLFFYKPVENPEKKKDKKELIKRYNPPLNLRDNHNPCIKDFQKEVSRRRRIIDELSNHLDYSPQ